MQLFSGVILRRLTIISVYLGLVIVIVVYLGCSRAPGPNFLQGEELYKTYCVVCHGVNGGGVLFSKSALNNDNFVIGNPDAVIAVILAGREGAGSMPAWNMTLKDQEVAAVATYIRQAWSNRAEPVTAAMVSEIKAKIAQKPTTN